ncbi:hypothetical protein ALI44B_04590 [Leifsonia sp. ALI-44-B]|uniref:hypothetical protein n=1 Tax=Leifsonia sp. ALI-44-B TaxID=1933776 RepID=UPI00097C8A32|nr:hypothetical protein [Leifsonia sp. ALI-44-B]ONI63908.1 hypothetical protein ALI44B_04590 [Leifsonia sp. ALI-44-B]
MTVWTWYTFTTIRDVWDDAPQDDDILRLVMDSAKAQVLEFAPELEEDDPLPERYVLAHLMQTRNLWNASKIDPDGGMGEGEFVLRPFPLDWQVKALLRPKRAVPVAL